MSFFSFLKPAEHAAGAAVKDVKKATKSSFNFLAGAERQVNTLDNNATFKNPQGSPQKQSIARQYVQNLTKEKDFAVNAARSVPRAGATIGKSIADVTNPALGLPVVPAYHPTNPIAEAVLGKEPIKSAQQRSSETEKKLEGSRFHDFAAPLAALGTGLSIGADALPVGGPAKKGIEEGISKLAKATTPAEVRNIMKGTDPALVDKVAHAIAKTKDPNIIRNIIDKANNPLPKGPSALSSPEVSAAPVGQDIVKATVPETPKVEIPNLSSFQRLADSSEHFKDFSKKFQELPSTPALQAEIKKLPPDMTLEDFYGRLREKSFHEAGQPPNPVQKVVEALRGQPAAEGQSPVKGIGSLQTQQKGLYSAERSSRLAKATQAGANLTGRDAVYAQLGKLKGELPKVNADALMEHLQSKVSADDVNGVLDTIKTSPHLTGFEPITAQNAVVKLFDEGKLPAPKEWELLQKAVGPDFVDAIKGSAEASLTKTDKLKNIAMDTLSLPRALLASGDLSAGGRQGGILGSRFPGTWAVAEKEGVKSAVSKTGHEKMLQGLQDLTTDSGTPLADYYKKAGVDIAGPEGTIPHEEQYASHFSEKIPGVGASNRAFTGTLSYMRAHSFKSVIDGVEQGTGKTIDQWTPKEIKSLGKFINTSSGRGHGKPGGWFEKAAPVLGDTLFSARLWKSRLDVLNPKYYYDLKGPARKLALQSASSFAGVAGTILGLAVAAGGAVETDPRSSDFLKVKFGNTRYDILGGLQQNLVFAWRELSGQKKSSQTGRVSNLTSGAFGGANRLSVLSDLIQSKENPIISTGSTIIKGTDKSGQPVNNATTIGNLFVPLGGQDTYKAVKDEARDGGYSAKNIAKGVGKAAPGFVGAGVGTYGVQDLPVTSAQGKYIQKLKNQGASKEKVDATKLFYQVIKTAPSKTDASAKIDKILGDDKIPLDKAVSQAKQIAKDYNNKYYDTIDKAWLKQYKQYGDEQMVKDFNKGKLKFDDAAIKKRLAKIKEDKASAPVGG